jgi:YD repeat-containing protein
VRRIFLSEHFRDDGDKITSATYTPAFKTATTTDAAGNVTTYAYNNLGLVSSVTDPENRVTSYAYDALGRPTTTKNTAIQEQYGAIHLRQQRQCAQQTGRRKRDKPRPPS